MKTKQRFRIFGRGKGCFYLEDTLTHKQTSLRTSDKQEAERLLHAHREAQQKLEINRHLARAYLTASDPKMVTRTWMDVMTTILETKQGETHYRWTTAIKDRAFDSIRLKPIVETTSDQFLQCLKAGTVSTNRYLRQLHNFAVDMDWLVKPVLPKRLSPSLSYKKKRAITLEEHKTIIKRETNREGRAFYELLWHTGGAQADISNLQATDIDWQRNVLTFSRKKLKGRGNQVAQVRTGPETRQTLQSLPTTGHLFPYLRTGRSSDRATEFKQRCDGLGITGITLHCYRYVWAQRAKAAGYPERFAMARRPEIQKFVAHCRDAERGKASSSRPAGLQMMPFARPKLSNPKSS